MISIYLPSVKKSGKRYIESLFLEAREGNQAAESELFEALSKRFSYLARKRIWEKEDAQEIAQEALMRVFSKYKEMEHHDNYTAWAYTILKNIVLNFYRKKSFRESKLKDVKNNKTNQYQDSGNPDFVRKLLNCVRLLISEHPQQARVLNLHYLGYTTQEICDRLNISSNNLYQILCRTRSLLKHCLEKGDMNQ